MAHGSNAGGFLFLEIWVCKQNIERWKAQLDGRAGTERAALLRDLIAVEERKLRRLLTDSEAQTGDDG